MSALIDHINQSEYSEAIPSSLLPYFIDMSEVDDVRRQLMKPYGYKEIDQKLLYRMCLMCISALHKVNWNEYNSQHYGRQVVTIDEAIFLPDLPPVPKPYRSWPEAMIMIFGGFQGLEYEPKSQKKTYVLEHTYQPDAVDDKNSNILYEIKGVIPNLVDASKYRAVAKQHKCHIIFVFQEKGIFCPWARSRVDGSRMTQEEWVKKEGFDYCYVGEEAEFRNTERYKWLVENVGK